MFTTDMKCEHLFFLKWKHFKSNLNHDLCYAMLCYDMIWQMKIYEIVCYVWDSNAMVWDLNAMTCYGVCCKGYA